MILFQINASTPGYKYYYHLYRHAIDIQEVVKPLNRPRKRGDNKQPNTPYIILY